ncbi:hypothetical protein AB0L53_04250 [Nonomuraea sp. NPDC052129]|uniref:hypothetical protein n=1 Tax=Nonomuraea sp. NPDC052129 TaxID=3154651 RepID=UPI00342FB213
MAHGDVTDEGWALIDEVRGDGPRHDAGCRRAGQVIEEHGELDLGYAVGVAGAGGPPLGST